MKKCDTCYGNNMYRIYKRKPFWARYVLLVFSGPFSFEVEGYQWFFSCSSARNKLVSIRNVEKAYMIHKLHGKTIVTSFID